jgi:hypothetical protein
LTARAVFVGGYRMGHAIMSFQFDHFLEGIDKTYIISNISEHHYRATLEKYVDDPSRFVYVNDQELIDAYPEILHWDQPGDYRGTWLRQQALKIACLDYFDEESFLIQDPDTFAIRPYKCFDGKTPNFFVLPNTTHSPGYYSVIEDSLGIKRQTTDCFITEFLPFLKEDWVAMRQQIEQKHNKHFLDAIIDSCHREAETNLIWFSEYELLGNYALTRRNIDTTVQHRCEIRNIGDLSKLNSVDYNCYVDACPNLDDSILFEFVSNTVINFDKIYNDISSRI